MGWLKPKNISRYCPFKTCFSLLFDKAKRSFIKKDALIKFGGTEKCKF